METWQSGQMEAWNFCLTQLTLSSQSAHFAVVISVSHNADRVGVGVGADYCDSSITVQCEMGILH